MLLRNTFNFNDFVAASNPCVAHVKHKNPVNKIYQFLYLLVVQPILAQELVYFEKPKH